MAMKTDLELFQELSSYLTGVKVSSFNRSQKQPAKTGDLEPRNGPVLLGPVYLQLLQEWEDGIGITKLLKRFGEVQPPQTPTDAVRQLLADKELGPICHSIIKLWYLGVWYPPDNPSVASHVVSTQSYVESLIWKVMQAHPAGYSMGYFGHWSEEPPPLDEFITFAN